MSFIVLFLLYFPEDKREYIPAAITTVIFFIAAFICFRLIVRASKKQERIDEKRTKKWINHFLLVSSGNFTVTVVPDCSELLKRMVPW